MEHPVYSHQKLNMYFTGSHLRAVTDADDDDDNDADNAGRHSTTTRATYRQLARSVETIG